MKEWGRQHRAGWGDKELSSAWGRFELSVGHEILSRPLDRVQGRDRPEVQTRDHPYEGGV